MDQTYAVLHNGVKMPFLGIGTFKATKAKEVKAAVQTALELGYRHIDTAAIYQNEEFIGEELQNNEVGREEIFLVSKVWNSDQGYQSTKKAFAESLERLRTDYLDLYLIHWPKKLNAETWKAMEELYREGKIKAIGVSNFLQHHLEELLKTAEIIPMVNQIEFHPRLVQPNLLKYCQEKKIQVEAWSPLMQGDLAAVPKLAELAAKYQKTPAQVVLRWNIQMNVVTIPKSIHAERIQENALIFDFALTDEEVAALTAVDENFRYGPHPDHINF